MAARRATLVGLASLMLLGCGTLGAPVPSAGPDGTRVVVGGSPLLGKPAPLFTLQDLDGTEVALVDLRGRPVIVNFWASWCIPCRKEFPVFVAGREAYADAGLEILGVVYKDDAANARRFATDNGATWPLLLDPGERTYAAYLGFGVPYTVFIDGEGIVQGVSFGEVTDAGFADQVGRIIPAPDASPAS